MTINQILIIVLTAFLWGAVVRERGRSWFLLVASVIVIFWLQPALPIRGFDFWIPVATLVITIFSWYISADDEARRKRKNWGILALVAGIVLLLSLTRYVPAAQIFTASRPPQTETLLAVVAVSALVFLGTTRLNRFSKTLLAIGIFILIGIFFVLKIPALTHWLSYGLRALMSQSLTNVNASDFRWLGFSYVAFRLLHTLRDRQMGRLPSVDLGEYLTYVIFFPAFTAGPIDRIERFIKDLRQPFTGLDTGRLSDAGQRLTIGLFKKFVIADSLALIALNDTNALQVNSTGWMWILVYAYAFQIFFDFSGYTDIALGTARLVGIQLPENFNYPYLKPNLTQFWNNWHMTLTQWFRAYFFNPVTRWMRSWDKPLSVPMMILSTQVATMVLIGFWHGGTWNFILWGLWHGLGLFVHNRWNDATKVRAAAWATTPARQAMFNISGILFTFHFVALGWIFFALSSPAVSWQVILKLFGVN
jgi:alginate O-acetyltransferase complex protein AlgI